jgi:glycerol-3-phosphate responsive antiterminator
MFDLLQEAEGCERRFVHGHPRLEVYVLLKESEIKTTRANHVAAIRRFFAADQTKQRSLSGTIPAYQPDVLARVNLQ